MSQARNPTHGQKVTDSNAPEIEEGSGPVASDSLAAESSNTGGGFSENRGSEPLGVSGKNSTFANSDTSAARRLDPTSDAEARPDDESYPGSTGGQSKGLAVTDTQGSYDTSDNSSAGTAPSYVNSQFVDDGGPKGKNLTEGFEDGKEAGANGEVGGKFDPGRLAEEKFTKQNADFSESAGFPTQKGDSGDNTYSSLDDTSA